MAIYDNILIRLDNPIIDQNAAFAALKRLEGEQKRRIHQRGSGTSGKKLKTFAKVQDPAGFYSKQHAKRRRKARRTVSQKDLQLFGGFIQSYTVGTYNERYVYGFLTDKARLIAEGQEQQTRQPIFSVSASERELVLRIYSEQVVKDIFQ